MTTKHTPGPWHVATCPSPDYLRVVNSTGKLGIVTVTVRDSIPIETRDANTHLIAAAPDMLAALEELLATALKVDDIAWAASVERAGTNRPCDAARAAIAKATGSAST